MTRPFSVIALFPLLLAPLVALGGCASPGGGLTNKKTPHSGATAQPGKNSLPPGLITGLSADSGDEKTTLHIRGNHKLTFTSYRMKQPERLAIEFRGAHNGMRRKNIPIDDSMVGSVHLVPFKRVHALRMEIGIKMPYNYDLRQRDERLEVVITSDKGSAAYRYKKKLVAAEEKIVRLEKKLARVSQAPEALKKTSTQPTTPEKNAIRQRESAIRMAVDKWLVAWRNKDIVNYGLAYDDAFRHKGFNRASWLRDKERKFSRPGLIAVKAKNLRLRSTQTSATVIFLQQYQAGRYSDVGWKTLGMIPIKGKWKIVSENWSAIR